MNMPDNVRREKHNNHFYAASSEVRHEMDSTVLKRKAELDAKLIAITSQSLPACDQTIGPNLLDIIKLN